MSAITLALQPGNKLLKISGARLLTPLPISNTLVSDATLSAFAILCFESMLLVPVKNKPTIKVQNNLVPLQANKKETNRTKIK